MLKITDDRKCSVSAISIQPHIDMNHLITFQLAWNKRVQLLNGYDSNHLSRTWIDRSDRIFAGDSYVAIARIHTIRHRMNMGSMPADGSSFDFVPFRKPALCCPAHARLDIVTGPYRLGTTYGNLVSTEFGICLSRPIRHGLTRAYPRCP